jgi:hypothetical protein
VRVPVPGPAPAGRGSVPVPAPAPGWGAPGIASPPARPALPPAPVILPAVPRLIAPGPWNTQRRSLADMANEQLRRGAEKDPLRQGMEDAARDDCLHAQRKPGETSGLLNAPDVINRALSGRCPK